MIHAFAVDLLGELGEGLHAVPGARLGKVRPSLGLLLFGGRGLQLLEQRLNLDVGVPDIQVAHPGGLLHPRPIILGHRKHDRAPLSGSEPAVTASDLKTRRQPLHIPLPRAGQGLVEVVDVEHHLPLRRGEHPEVRQVRVTADLGVQAGAGGGRQVGGHDQRGAPIERERRHQHPAVTDGNQLRHPGYRLLLEQRDRVGPVDGRLPTAMAGPGNLVTRRLPPGNTLPRSQVRDLACDTSTGVAAPSPRSVSGSAGEISPFTVRLASRDFFVMIALPQSSLVSGWHVRTQMASAALEPSCRKQDRGRSLDHQRRTPVRRGRRHSEEFSERCIHRRRGARHRR